MSTYTLRIGIGSFVKVKKTANGTKVEVEILPAIVVHKGSGMVPVLKWSLESKRHTWQELQDFAHGIWKQAVSGGERRPVVLVVTSEDLSFLAEHIKGLPVAAFRMNNAGGMCWHLPQPDQQRMAA